LKKWFYERSRFDTFKSNTTYHKLLQMNADEFTEWARLLRQEVTTQWDEYGTPPVIGKDEDGLITNFKKLKGNPCDYLIDDNTGDEESLGIIKNFNKDASGVNQFFPTMLKTKISIGKSADNGLSIYDHFGDPEMEEKFVHIMRRAVKRDSMYSWSRSIVTKKDENPFWNGQDGKDFIRDIHEGKVSIGKYSDTRFVLARVKENTVGNYGTMNEEYKGHGNVYLTAEDVQECKDNGWLTDTMLSNVDEIISEETSKSGKVTKFLYLIRHYDKTTGIFPKILQVFRLACGQPAVNFPPLTAKLLYEKFTDHIDNQEQRFHIYDPSSGWGGRILGAMSSRKKIHYIGTDPNPDNFGRYEAVADFYNSNCVDDFSETFTQFFEVEKQSNTYDVYREGSELIGNNSKFQSYKGALDLVFTSPPYFNREQYSQDENQSFKAYSQYEDWVENFLRPTLTTAYEYLKNDRYILWNIASIKIGANTYYDLEGDSKKILEELGCEYKGKLKMLMTRMIGLDPSKTGILNSVQHDNNVYKYEPIFVYYKP
jgi:hypothetical protein